MSVARSRPATVACASLPSGNRTPISSLWIVWSAVTTIPGADPAKTRECDVCGQTIAGDVLHGHIDWITDFIETGTSFVTDHKSSGDFGFQKLDDETNEGYVQQVCGYIYGLQQDEMDLRHGLILFKNKNNAQYRLVGIDYDAADDTAQVVHLWNGKTFFLRDVVRRLIGLHAQVETARNTGVLPDRPYSFDDWQCEWCPRQNACWDSYPDEIAARAELKGALKDDDPLPFDLSNLSPATFVGEVVMKKEITPLLEIARAKGCRYVLGTEMLFEMIPAYLEFFGFGTATPDELKSVARISY